MAPDYLCGVVEGFYGRSWDWADRGGYASFLPRVGLNTYVYAPKSDACLRTNWAKPWSDSELAALSSCARQFAGQGVTFGIGISPIGLAGRPSRQQLADLQVKLEQMASVSTSLWCILFDDVPSSGADMASCQAYLYDRIRSVGSPERIIVCPSYYSTDPVLEKLFGPRPPDYWRELGKALDSDVDFFWTGERVCSDDYSKENLEFIADQMQRLPVLWDNYPVNDGAKASRFLHLDPYSGRHAFLGSYTAGHLANPMNQPWLSRLPLATLSSVVTGAKYEQRLHAWDAMIQELMPDDVDRFRKDAAVFSARGLEDFTRQEKDSMAAYYATVESPAAVELVAWLREEYAFDPACLTG